MDVVAGVVGGVELDDPVYGGNLRACKPGFQKGRRERKDTHIEATRRNVGADKGAGLCVAELEERVGPGLLLHLAVQMQHRQVDEIE